MTNGPLTGPNGRPLERTLTTAAQIKHCGDCRHAVLMAGPDGRMPDITIRYCLGGPLQIVMAPVFQKTQVRMTPQGPVGGAPVFVGMQQLSQYPAVNLRMRACAKWEAKSADDRAADEIDRHAAQSGTPLDGQREN